MQTLKTTFISCALAQRTLSLKQASLVLVGISRSINLQIVKSIIKRDSKSIRVKIVSKNQSENERIIFTTTCHVKTRKHAKTCVLFCRQNSTELCSLTN